MRKTFVSLILITMIGISGCLDISNRATFESQDSDKTEGIISNTNRLYDDYKWKLDLVTEIQQRTDALGTAATKDMYVEWVRRDNEAIDAGERLATYITEQKSILNQYWTSDVLVLIAKNKVTFERDNQALEQTINSLERSAKLYTWQIDYYGIEGSKNLGTLTFENKGQNLSNVKFKFVFYTTSGNLYSEESFYVGNVASGKVVQKKVSLPARYWGQETWSKEKMYIYINGTIEKIWVYENDEWNEQQINKTN